MLLSASKMRSLAGSLTVNKSINAARILSSYYYSRISRKPAVDMAGGMPVAVSIEPTTSCNLRCPECPSGLRSFTRPTGAMDASLFQQIIGELKEHLVYLTFYFQGEPYLNPGFLDMTAYAASAGIYTSTSTNAHYLDDETARRTVESGLRRIIISIDGATQETYQQYRIGGSLQKVLEGTANLVKWKRKMKSSTPHVVFQFLVVRHNEHEINDLYRLAKQYGADEVLLKTAQIYDYENGSPLLPLDEKYSRYRQQKDGSWKLKNNLLNHCWKMWHSCVITWDGTVVPCCFDKDAAHPMGNLHKQSFREIWFGEPYRHFRQQLFRSRSETDICKNCTEGTKVWS